MACPFNKAKEGVLDVLVEKFAIRKVSSNFVSRILRFELTVCCPITYRLIGYKGIKASNFKIPLKPVIAAELAVYFFVFCTGIILNISVLQVVKKLRTRVSNSSY